MFMIILYVVLFAVVFYFLGSILLAYLFRYRPKNIEENEVVKPSDISLNIDEITIYTWNVGYAGLDQSSDFFYDGGKMVRPTRAKVESNIKGIVEELTSWNDTDFILLQEVDICSKRSWYFPLKDKISKSLMNEFPLSVFSKNYDVKYIPYPIFQPMGKVCSGLLTLSKHPIHSAQRVDFSANFPFPKGLFFLNRCFQVNRLKYLDNELIVINTHHSAFDGGKLKSQEMEILKSFILQEYHQGNYVIVGGDWNQVPPDFIKGHHVKYEETGVEQNFPELGWKWIYDTETRTNRKVDTPFVEGITYTTVFDFFLISPNIKALEIECLQRNFRFSDHNPVRIKVSLKN